MLTTTPDSGASLSSAVWIDLCDASDEERNGVEQAMKLRLPTKAAISEIESSSRAFVENEAFYLSSPVLQGTNCLKDQLTIVSFVLSRDRLITLRFARVAAFEDVTSSLKEAPQLGGSDIFLKIVEKLVDHAADALEHASAELESISHAAFHAEHPRGYNLSKASRALHAAVRKLGQMDGGISHVRESLLGIGRIAAFVQEAEEIHLALEPGRLNAIRTDIASLNDHQNHLSNKVQFLLDATLGFIGIQQNDIVKTLTIASVVGVPPVLIAGIYGMNFKFMPELGWTFGYPFALLLVVVSALVPVVWFKWRGWM